MIAPVALACPAAPIAEAAFAALPILRTSRLLLRAPKIDDFALFAELYASDRAAFIGGQKSVEDAWTDFTNYTAGWLLRGDGMFTMAGDGKVLGFIFAGVEIGDEDIELGFLISPEAEGRGLAHEASRAVLEHLWGVGATRVVSYIDPENRRAIALAKRLGGTEDGMLQGSLVFRHQSDQRGALQ